jgi:PAS domain-containing protein
MSDADESTRQRHLAAADVARLRDLLDDRPDAIVTITRSDGRLLWGSRAGSEELFHRRPTDYVDREIWPYIHPDDRDEVAVAVSPSVASRRAPATIRAVAADGHWRRVRTVTWRSSLGTGEVVLVHVTVPATRRRGRPSGRRPATTARPSRAPVVPGSPG